MIKKTLLTIAAAAAALGVATPASATLTATGNGYSPTEVFGGFTIAGTDHRGVVGRFNAMFQDNATQSPVDFITFCIDALTSFDTSVTFDDLPAGSFIVNTVKRQQLAALLANGNPLIDAASGQQQSDFAAAIGLAVWEVIYENGTSGYSVDGGNFSVNGDFALLSGLTNGYLANVEGGTWTGDANLLRVLAPVEAGTSQAQIYLTSAVPEPASWALMIGGLFGLGALLRRRRAPKPLAAHA